jgi:hypothetical protein
MNDISTREKILQRAHKLFAEKGYNGVSIREISTAAEVNVAAVNYHFKNKENLFQETVKASIQLMTEDIRLIYAEDESISVEGLSHKLMKYFTDNADDLKTCFKMFVIDVDVYPEDTLSSEDDMIGPPGGRYIFECIKKEKPNASYDDNIWAVRTIFTIIIHQALISTSSCIQSRETQYKMSENDFVESLNRLVKVVLADI